MELIMGEELTRDPTIWRILYEGGIEGFIDSLNGQNTELSRKMVDI